MNETSFSIRSAPRYLLSWLIIIALFITALPVAAQGPDEEPSKQSDSTAKRAPQVRGERHLVPTKERAIVSEDFEDGVMPPPGWTHIQTNLNETWQINTYNPYNGIYYASVFYDAALLSQDEVLLSPAFTGDSGNVSLWSLGSLYWCRDTYDNCDLEVWFVNGGWGGGDDVFLGLADNDWTATWAWSHTTFDFSPYASGGPAQIAFRYVGYDGAEVSLDEIDINFFDSTCNDPYEPNNVPGQATSIGYGAALTSPDICPAGDEDYYAFYGNAGDPIVVDIDASDIGSALDPVIHLYDTDGVTELAWNDDYNSLDSYLEYTLPANGTYYLKVRDYGTPHGGPSYFYTLFLYNANVGPLVYDGYTVDDDNNGNSSGDGDGIVECGETIELFVDLYNQGSETATGIYATISSSDPYITWLFNTDSSYPDIPSGGTGTNTNDFDFEVDPNTPSGHVINFDLDIISSGGPDTDSFSVPVECGGGTQAQWTFMVYLDGDNNLEGAGIDDFMEMSSVGSTSDVNILVQFDRVSGYNSSYGDWTSTKRYYITPGMTPHAGNALQDIGEANMGHPQTLVDFVQWGMTNYPADHYAIVLWDHGSGWRLGDEKAALLKDVAYDDTSGGDALDMPELRGAMDTLSNSGSDPLDLVGFDACLMGMTEVDNQLIPYADVRVGSEETEPWDGWPFDTILSALVGNPAMTASQLGTTIVDQYYVSYGNSQTQSSVDLQAFYGALNTAVNNFAVALINGVGSHYADIATARANTQEFANVSYVDLYDLAYQINLAVNDATIDAAASAVMNAVNSAVTHEQHGASWPGAHGISIYYPASLFSYNSTYDGSAGWLEFTANTQWDEWLHVFYNPVTVNAPWLDDMESGASDWTADGFWHLVQDGASPYPESHSPTHSWWYGQDATGNYDNGYTNAGGLTSPAINIPSSAPGASLSFWSWYETETNGAGYDQRWVQISVNGAPYQNLAQLSGDAMQTWVEYTFDLSAYASAGDQVRIRFYFDTLDSAYNDYRGWYIDDVFVDTGTSYVGPVEYNGHILDDDNSGESTGNNDGIADPGETVEMYVELVNQGTDPASGVVATISTSDPYVTWPHNTASNYPDIPGGGTATNIDDFDFALDATAPIGHQVHFDLVINATNGGPWSDSFYIIVGQPIQVGPVDYFPPPIIDDDNNGQSVGNDDGEINPGEVIELYPKATNTGNTTALSVEGCLSEDSPYVPGFLYNTCSYYGDISPGGTAINIDDFDFEVDGSTPIGHQIPFTLIFSATNAGPWTQTFFIQVMGDADAALRIEPPDQEVCLSSGDLVVDVLVEDVIDLGAFEFDLVYDPTVVAATAVDLGPFLGSSGCTVMEAGPNIDNVTGRLEYGGLILGACTGPSGSGVVATVHFQPLAVGESDLNLENEQLLNTDDPPVPITPVDLYHGHIIITDCFFADVDRDGDVDIADIYYVAYHWWCQCGDACYISAYDLNNDCDIDIVDVQIAACYFGWPNGDFSACYTPTRLSMASVSKQSSTLRLTPKTMHVSPGKSFTVDLVVDQGQDLAGFEATLHYDPQVLRFDGFALGDFLSSTGNTALPQEARADDKAGTVTFGGFSFGDYKSPGGTGTLVTLTFTAQGLGHSPLTLSDVLLVHRSGLTQPTPLTGGGRVVSGWYRDLPRTDD